MKHAISAIRQYLYLFIGLFAVCTIVSCGSPTAVSEKALKLVGKGTFVPTDLERQLGMKPLATIGLTLDYKDIFDSALERSYEAKDFREKGVYKETSLFDFSNVLFDKFELINIIEYTQDLYRMADYARDRERGDSEQMIATMRDVHKRLGQDYIENGDSATWIEAKDVPSYELRYKLDNRYIANITVIKLPDEGYRVCAFRIE